MKKHSITPSVKSLEYSEALQAYKNTRTTIENGLGDSDSYAEIKISFPDPSINTRHTVTVVELAYTQTLQLYRWSVENSKQQAIKVLKTETHQCASCRHFYFAKSKSFCLLVGQFIDCSYQLVASPIPCPVCLVPAGVEIRHHGHWYRLDRHIYLSSQDANYVREAGASRETTNTLLQAIGIESFIQAFESGEERIQKSCLKPAYKLYTDYANRALKRKKEALHQLHPRYLHFDSPDCQEASQKAELAAQVLRTEFR